MIKILKLNKSFKERKIYKNLSFEFPSTGLIGVLGDSGSGKTTLLNLISGIDNDYVGDIYIDKTRLKDLNDKEMGAYRIKNIGFVFQTFNLMNLDTVEQNVRLPLESISSKTISRLNKRVDDVLRIVNLTSKKKEKIQNLSGGQKQRVAIARAIINNPKIILCDEPTGALDENNGKEIMDLLLKISKKSLVIVSTHDRELISKYATQLVIVKDFGLELKINNQITVNHSSPLVRDIGKISNKPSLPLAFKIRHAFQQMRAKKYRTLITNIMISLSLTSIGASLILSDSLSNRINTAFSSLFTSPQIVMTPKRSNPNIFDGIYGASRSQVEDIYARYKYYLDDFGVTYMVNFEDFFKDNNEIYISSTPYKISLNNYSARSINDFRWMSEDDLDKTYPVISSLNNDEIVLGLKYEDMTNICYQLHIQRNYTSLGRYLRNTGLFVTFSVENSSWQYDDEQLFKVKGVIQTEMPVIYHTNKLWNEYVFEEQMRFPGGDGTYSPLPWTMNKIYYLKTKEDPSNFLDASIYDDNLYDFVFERTNYKFHPTLCKSNEVCRENRLLVYYVDKLSIHMSDVKTIIKYCPELSNYYVMSNYGYISYGASLLSGFAKNAFIGVDEDLINYACDADSTLNNEGNESIDLPDGVIQGNYSNSVSGGFQYSSHFKEIIQGNIPKLPNEIAISKGLLKSLKLDENSLNKRLYFAAISNEYFEGDTLYKEYSKTDVKITAIIDEDRNVIYQSPNWSVSFFRDELGISSFNLTPLGVVFEFGQNVDVNPLVQKLQKMFKDYNFLDPISNALESVKSTASYMKTILIIFSSITMVVAIILLSLTILINAIENEHEVSLFSLIGYNRFDINSLFVTHSLLQGIFSFFLSSVELIAIDYIVNLMMGKMTGTSLAFSVNLNAILVEFILMLIISILTSLVVIFALSIKQKRKRK